MKKIGFWIGASVVLAPTAGCIALGIILGQSILSNAEMAMLLKVFAYLFVALIIIGLIASVLLAFILVIGKGLGFSQGDTRSALQAAISLARSSGTIGRLYNRIPKGFLPPGSYQQPPLYQYPDLNQAINGEAHTMDTEQANAPAWEK